MALDYAVDLASKIGSTVHLLNVINGPALGMPEITSGTLVEDVIAEHKRLLDEVAARYRGRVMIGKVMLETGDATDVITDTATKIGADLIVMGTHGRTGVTRFLLGSIAETVVRTSPCPVLTLHTHDKIDDAKAA